MGPARISTRPFSENAHEAIDDGVKVKAGDLLSIPPYTWHVAYGDTGVPLQYTIIHIYTRQTIP
jgi:hypothetical protein